MLRFIFNAYFAFFWVRNYRFFQLAWQQEFLTNFHAKKAFLIIIQHYFRRVTSLAEWHDAQGKLLYSADFAFLALLFTSKKPIRYANRHAIFNS